MAPRVYFLKILEMYFIISQSNPSTSDVQYSLIQCDSERQITGTKERGVVFLCVVKGWKALSQLCVSSLSCGFVSRANQRNDTRLISR